MNARLMVGAALVYALASTHLAGQGGAPSAIRSDADGPAATTRLVLKGPVPRTRDGKPDLRGHWNSPPLYNSNILEEHPAGFGILAGKSVVIDPPDGVIPYQRWALAQRNENRKAENAYLDNEGRCFPSGVPRIMLFSFDIQYAAHEILLFFEYVHATRIIHMDRRTHIPANIRSFFGDSIGYWEADTLVVETTNLNGKFWFALGGDFMTEAGRVVERFWMPDINTLGWQATITDPKTFTRPWTWQWNRHYVRGVENEILDNHCHEGNSDLVHLKNTYEAALPNAAATASPSSAGPRVRRPFPVGQGKFSGRWVFNQQASGRNEGGTSLPSELLLAQTSDELYLQGTSSRQDPLEIVYELDGSQVNAQVSAAIFETGRARLDGENLVITMRRTFASPAGQVVADIRDVYSVTGNVLTVQRTQTIDGVASAAKAVYNKAP
jgi:hypothetical protein